MSDHDLQTRWLAGDDEAARVLAAGMTAVELRRFGTEALAACCQVVEAPVAVTNLVLIARTEPHRGHEAFDAVRALSHRTRANSSEAPLLYAAEAVARVTYNSTSPDDPFDADADELVFISIAGFCISLTIARRADLAHQLRRLVESTRACRTGTVDVEAIRIAKFAARWFVGDADSLRAFADSLNNDELKVLAVEVLAACCAAVDDPPFILLEAVAAARTAARADDERLRLPPREHTTSPSIHDRLLAVGECAASVVRDEPQPKSTTWGYLVLLASCCLAAALPRDSQAALNQELLAALAKAKGKTGLLLSQDGA